MIESTHSITINKPLSIVYVYTINPANAKDWYSNVKESHWDQNEDIAEGKIVKLLTNIMGKDYRFDYEIKEKIDGSRFRMSAEHGAFPMESEYAFSAIDDIHTRVTITTRAKPKGVPFFMISMVKDKVNKTLAEDIQTLKKNIEAL